MCRTISSSRTCGSSRRFSGNRVVSAIVNGWMLNSMVTWQSGFPFTISSGRDNSFTGIGRDRADFLGGDADLGSDRPHGEMVARYFDTSKFVANAIGTFGNSAKNMLRGPRYFNTDVALLKVTTISQTIDAAVSGRVLQHLQQRQLQRAEQQRGVGPVRTDHVGAGSTHHSVRCEAAVLEVLTLRTCAFESNVAASPSMVA